MSSLALSITAKVDRDSIAMSETLTLTVTVDEQVAFSAPSFEELSQNFDILRQHKSNRYQSMNGQVTSVTEWVLTLGPKREGQLIIPSFEYEGEYSDAIPIKVSKQSSPNQAQQDIFLEASADKKDAFVQEQIIFTQKLYSAVNLSSFDPEALQISGARVELLSEFDYQTRIGNRPYVVVESRYAIYPQQSGTLTIPALRWNIGVSGGRRNVFDPFSNNSGRIHRLRSDAIEISIKASPADASPWLPASRLELSQSWSSDPEKMRVGEPITRHIEILAQGLTAAQLPNVEMGSDATLQGKIKTYLEQPQTEDQKNNNGIIGKRRISTAIIPSQTGPLTLPAIEIRWWNTLQNQWQTAKLPEMTVQVLPGVTGQPQVPVQTERPAGLSGTQAIEAQENQTESRRQNEEIEQSAAASSALVWILYSVLVTLLSLALVVFCWRLWREKNALKAQLNHVEASSRPNSPATTSLNDILVQGDDLARYQALQKYVGEQRATHPHFATVYDSSELAKLIQILESNLYGNDRQTSQAIANRELEDAIVQFQQSLQQVKADHSDLPPLYPH
ncbi:BatD family protein [Pseudoteredinibacter isoporae]